jgi:hypothetical protein
MRREASLDDRQRRKRRLPPGLAEGGNGQFEFRIVIGDAERPVEYGFAPETVTENSKFVTQKSGKVTENSGNGHAGVGRSSE